MTQPLFHSEDFDGSGLVAAKKGMDSVLEPETDWHRATMRRLVPFMESHDELSAQDMDMYNLWAWGPHNPNAKGAFFRKLRERGYLGPVVRYVKSRHNSARGRAIPVYKSVFYRGDS